MLQLEREACMGGPHLVAEEHVASPGSRCTVCHLRVGISLHFPDLQMGGPTAADGRSCERIGFAARRISRIGRIDGTRGPEWSWCWCSYCTFPVSRDTAEMATRLRPDSSSTPSWFEEQKTSPVDGSQTGPSCANGQSSSATSRALIGSEVDPNSFRRTASAVDARRTRGLLPIAVPETEVG